MEKPHRSLVRSDDLPRPIAEVAIRDGEADGAVRQIFAGVSFAVGDALAERERTIIVPVVKPAAIRVEGFMAK